MKSSRLYLFVLPIFFYMIEGINAQPLRIMTFNIRYDNPKDSLNSWQYRKDFTASYLSFYDLDICGMQEALVHQCNYLDSVLEDYSYLGVGRDDGKDKGEYSPIFYNHSRLKPLESGTFWLSETPTVPGKAWDANLPRIVTWAKFKYKGKARTFYVFNTHFDHQGVVARRESARLLLSKVKEIAGNKEALITGDFNATPSEEPIQIITDSKNPLHLFDTEKYSNSKHFGAYSSFNGFQSTEQTGRHIDYIFLNKESIKVIRHGTLSHTMAGKYASDHHPVISILRF